jgi:hypothetical protein
MIRLASASLGIVLGLPLAAVAQALPPAAQHQPAATRHPEEGRPFIRHYKPVELGGESQNWALVQDARGVVYVGSSNGILEFDGATWRLIETPGGSTVRSLAIDPAGRIWVGLVGEFGYVAPDVAGQLRFVSLLDRVPAEARQFGDIWRTHVTDSGVVFQAPEAMFRCARETIQVLKPPSRFNRSSLLDGRVYVPIPESGLNVLESDTFRPLPGTDLLGREVFPIVLRYDDGRLLIERARPDSSCTTAQHWFPSGPT